MGKRIKKRMGICFNCCTISLRNDIVPVIGTTILTSMSWIESVNESDRSNSWVWFSTQGEVSGHPLGIYNDGSYTYNVGGSFNPTRYQRPAL